MQCGVVTMTYLQANTLALAEIQTDVRKRL